MTVLGARGRTRRWGRLGVAAAFLLVLAPGALLLRPAEGARPVSSSALGQISVVTMSVGGLSRDYRLFVPATGSGPRPLLLALHQLHGSAAAWEARSGLDAGAARAGVVVVYADGWKHSWDAGTCCQPAARRGVDDVAFLRAVVRDVSRRTAIDRTRVAVTGFSNGALMAYRLVCQAADTVHVAVAVAGDLMTPACRPSRAVSLLHVHGERDQIIPAGGVAHSPLVASGFPAARTSASLMALADGCTGSDVGVAGDVETWRATGCRAGGRVELLLSDSMAHTYPVGAAATSYGVDMATLTWQFLHTAWSG